MKFTSRIQPEAVSVEQMRNYPIETERQRLSDNIRLTDEQAEECLYGYISKIEDMDDNQVKIAYDRLTTSERVLY